MLPRRCPCGQRENLHWYRLFWDGLDFFRCHDCAKKVQMVLVPDNELKDWQRGMEQSSRVVRA